jgi:AsmA-like C-terminal region/AsmA family
VSDIPIETISHAEPFEDIRPRRRSWARWLKWILLALVSLWVIGLVVTLAIDFTGLQHTLTARLGSAFGRPIAVRAYAFSFWGPVVEARSVTVGEDPRFGHEYFLRADSMTVRLRWQSLLRGRIELGTLSLSHPSLNLVRDAAGQWNLAEWLPRPADSPSTALGASRLSRIAIDSGRINFKRGDDKLPVAFVNVNGTVETDSPGRWRIDLGATPWRAAVILQQAGDLRLSGYIGGTSSRLRPAALDLSWRDASLSDFLRLVRGDDSGIRGELALALAARTPAEPDGSWDIQGRALLRQIHRWDLAFRRDNPSVNLIIQTKWNPASPFLDFPNIAFEAPRSNAHGSGRLLVNHDQPVKAGKALPVQFTLSFAQIDLGDVLAWLRAFHPGISDEVSLRGRVSARGDLSGWTPDLASVSLSSDGIDFLGSALLEPVHVGPFEFRDSKGAISSTPITLAWGARAKSPDGSFRIGLSAHAPGAPPAWHISGSSMQMRDLIAAAGAFGWNISRGWDLSGPLACDLRWPPATEPWRTQPVGWLDFGAAGDDRGASLTAPFLNQPVQQIRAHVDLKPGDVRHIELSSAAAFGARWNGTFDGRTPPAEWQFALSADTVAAAGLDRWLNPVWREDFLGRMLPFLVSHPAANAVPENLRATGRLDLALFDLGSLAVSDLKGTLAIQGRHVTFANASGQFFGGAVSGSLDADLQAAPAYRASLDFSDVDLSAFSSASTELADMFAGSASGHASLRAAGANRSDLLASLECTGAASVADAVLRHMNLADSLREATLVPGTTALEKASGNFSCRKRQIQIQDLRLVHANGEIDAAGSVDFGRDLDLRLRVLPQATAGLDSTPAPDAPAAAYHVTGTLSAPQIAPISTPYPRASR